MTDNVFTKFYNGKTSPYGIGSWESQPKFKKSNSLPSYAALSSSKPLPKELSKYYDYFPSQQQINQKQLEDVKYQMLEHKLGNLEEENRIQKMKLNSYFYNKNNLFNGGNMEDLYNPLSNSVVLPNIAPKDQSKQISKLKLKNVHKQEEIDRLKNQLNHLRQKQYFRNELEAYKTRKNQKENEEKNNLAEALKKENEDTKNKINLFSEQAKELSDYIHSKVNDYQKSQAEAIENIRKAMKVKQENDERDQIFKSLPEMMEKLLDEKISKLQQEKNEEMEMLESHYKKKLEIQKQLINLEKERMEGEHQNKIDYLSRELKNLKENQMDVIGNLGDDFFPEGRNNNSNDVIKNQDNQINKVLNKSKSLPYDKTSLQPIQNDNSLMLLNNPNLPFNQISIDPGSGLPGIPALLSKNLTPEQLWKYNLEYMRIMDKIDDKDPFDKDDRKEYDIKNRGNKYYGFDYLFSPPKEDFGYIKPKKNLNYNSNKRYFPKFIRDLDKPQKNDLNMENYIDFEKLIKFRKQKRKERMREMENYKEKLGNGFKMNENGQEEVKPEEEKETNSNESRNESKEKSRHHHKHRRKDGNGSMGSGMYGYPNSSMSNYFGGFGMPNNSQSSSESSSYERRKRAKKTKSLKKKDSWLMINAQGLKPKKKK